MSSYRWPNRMTVDGIPNRKQAIIIFLSLLSFVPSTFLLQIDPYTQQPFLCSAFTVCQICIIPSLGLS
jgi:hypothetical protein